MVQLLKQQLSQTSIVNTLTARLSPSSAIANDTPSGLSTSLEPIVVSNVCQTVDDAENTAAPSSRSDGSKLPVMRPPLLHSTSLPSHYSHGTSLSEEASPSSSLATMLMDRMMSLETLVAEQQRKSEADMARLLNQVRLHRRLSVHGIYRLWGKFLWYFLLYG